MKAFEKMTWAEFLAFCLAAIGSGIAITLGGTASLIATATLGKYGKLVGAILFSFGIYSILTFKMKLFTGMVADIPSMGLKNCWRLPICFIGNVIGVVVTAFLISKTSVGTIVEAQGASMISAKLTKESWAMSALSSSILCGFLITLSVFSLHYAPKKGLTPTIGVLFPIVIFAFCGFDHSVANNLYFFFLGELSWKIVGYVLITILGNTIGGILIPSVSLFKERMNIE